MKPFLKNIPDIFANKLPHVNSYHEDVQDAIQIALAYLEDIVEEAQKQKEYNVALFFQHKINEIEESINYLASKDSN